MALARSALNKSDDEEASADTGGAGDCLVTSSGACASIRIGTDEVGAAPTRHQLDLPSLMLEGAFSRPLGDVVCFRHMHTSQTTPSDVHCLQDLQSSCVARNLCISTQTRSRSWPSQPTKTDGTFIGGRGHCGNTVSTRGNNGEGAHRRGNVTFVSPKHFVPLISLRRVSFILICFGDWASTW